jgi:hypothetical protein
MDRLYLNTTSYDGQVVEFTEKKRQEKAGKHPELTDPAFKVLVELAISSPTFVYDDFEHPGHRRVHYLNRTLSRSNRRYTKVVIEQRMAPHHVVTAYELDYVKEKSKNCKLLKGRYV